MELKKLVITLLIVALVLTGILASITKSKINIYTDAEHANYTQVLEPTGEKTIYYYYQSDCEYCNSIKDQVTDVYEASLSANGLQVMLVDMKETENQAAWYDWTEHREKFGEESKDPNDNPDYVSDPAKMKSVDDIKITGTPSMLYVDEEGNVIDFEIGGSLFDILEPVNEEFNLGVSLDRTRYGKN